MSETRHVHAGVSDEGRTGLRGAADGREPVSDAIAAQGLVALVRRLATRGPLFFDVTDLAIRSEIAVSP